MRMMITTLFCLLALPAFSRADMACSMLIAGADSSSHPLESTLSELLSQPAIQASDLLESLIEQYPILRKLYAAPIVQGLSVGDHAQARLQMLEKHYAALMPTESDPALRALLRLTAALHQIGYHVESKTGDSSARFTYRMLKTVLEQLEFDEEHVRLADFLVSTPVIVRLMQGSVTPERALSELTSLAQIRKIPVELALRAQLLLTLADQATDPTSDLTNPGQLEPAHSAYQDFKELIGVAR